jgi:hypothetical protein
VDQLEGSAVSVVEELDSAVLAPLVSLYNSVSLPPPLGPSYGVRSTGAQILPP